MVISQIAGIATAFGIGELSGAGFGPNYTILMKLGYEFYAPRILEEMEKNPNVFFQDTLWFQKFQKQIKSYTDKVMTETLDTLLKIPKKTIDAITDKFSEEGTSGFTGAPNIPVTVSPALNQIVTLTKVLEGLVKAFSNMNFNFNIVPQAFGSLPSGDGTLLNTPPTTGIPTQFTQPIDTEGPIQEFQTQTQIFNSTDNYETYRQRGGLLSKADFLLKKQGGVQPSPAQQNTKLTPEFVASLSRKDLEIGGQRTRNYKGKIIQWFGSHKITYAGNSYVQNIWVGKWQIQTQRSLPSLSSADAKVNKLKRDVGAAYVLTFFAGNVERYFLIRDL